MNLMFNRSIIWLLLLTITPLAAQDYYFEAFQPFDKSIPSPEEFLGYPIGEFHTRHDLVVAYMHTLAELSDKASIEVYGRTHENRKLLILQIASVSNMKNLDYIKKKHLEVVDPSVEVDNFTDLPIFVNLAYGVHGNEPSSTEAAMLIAYTLVASQSDDIRQYLDEAIVFLDPTINPDGRDRHSNWVNSFKGQPLISDKYDIEHNEAWPKGRTNHYWFDLNRDLLLAVNPESKGRLKWYHDWYPNVVTDFHEMGTNSTYFFEPKKKSAALNPVTPKENREVLNQIFADQFAADLNKIGSLYFTDEVYDSTYPGYGSTYMDLQGSLALLFEQASSRGHLQETPTGEMSFSFTIRNHFVSSIATLKTAVDNKDLLYRYQNDFFKNSIEKAKSSGVKAYVFGDDYDKNRNKAFLELLSHHQIEAFPLKNDLKVENETFKAQSAYVVPTSQKQYYLVQSLFETFESYRDSIFYDTSAWSMVNFYNLKYKALTKLPSVGEQITNESPRFKPKEPLKSDYAYIIPYEDYNAPALLYELQAKGLVLKVSTKPFSINSKDKKYSFNRGALLLSVHDQHNADSEELYTHLKQASIDWHVPVYAMDGGMTTVGNGLGSSSFKTLSMPHVMMVVEGTVSAYEAGEVWHLFEKRMHMPLVKVPERRFYLTDIYRYNVIIMVSGSYRLLNKQQKERLRQWVADGNTLITSGRGSSWAIQQKIATEKLISAKVDSVSRGDRKSYSSATAAIEKHNIGGGIFGIDLDITHPLAFGYLDREVPVYKNNRVWLMPSKNSYSTVGKYLDEPHIDGYISEKNLQIMKNAASIVVSRKGKGRIILFADNPNFRGAWYGTNKLFMNAVHFGSIIKVPQ